MLGMGLWIQEFESPMLHACGLLASEEAAQATEDAAQVRGFSGEDIVDHRMVVGGDFRFHEFRNGGDHGAGHFLTEAQRGKFLFKFVHDPNEDKSAGNRTRTCTPFDTRT